MGDKAVNMAKRVEKARRRVRALDGSRQRIARDIGAHYNWVRRFGDGLIKEPGAIRFAELEEWLIDNDSAYL